MEYKPNEIKIKKRQYEISYEIRYFDKIGEEKEIPADRGIILEIMLHIVINLQTIQQFVLFVEVKVRNRLERIVMV